MRKKSLGQDHPEVASKIDNLANRYYSEGRYEIAEPLYVEALDIAERVLGESHPHTQTFRENYQILLSEKN